MKWKFLSVKMCKLGLKSVYLELEREQEAEEIAKFKTTIESLMFSGN